MLYTFQVRWVVFQFLQCTTARLYHYYLINTPYKYRRNYTEWVAVCFLFKWNKPTLSSLINSPTCVAKLSESLSLSTHGGQIHTAAGLGLLNYWIRKHSVSHFVCCITTRCMVYGNTLFYDVLFIPSASVIGASSLYFLPMRMRCNDDVNLT